MKKQLSEKEKFNKWMAKKVQSIHYSNNEKMCNAFDRITEKTTPTKNLKLC